MLLALLIAQAVSASPEIRESGRLSFYWPGDGSTGRVMACDTPRRRRFYEAGSVHLAHRRWWKIGCGTVVRVCVPSTGRCADAPVLDGGPWGITDGAGGWRVWTKPRELPPGWRYRGLVDLSRALWEKLGKPPFLSRVKISYRRRPGRR